MAHLAEAPAALGSDTRAATVEGREKDEPVFSVGKELLSDTGAGM